MRGIFAWFGRCARTLSGAPLSASVRVVFALGLLSLLPEVADGQPFAERSVLSSGKWRKVSVAETGVYRLSASELAQMGFPDISKVRIYGSGGRQASFVVGQDSRDDLTLMPTYRTSASLLFYAEGPHSWTVDGQGAYSPSFNSYSKKAYYFITTGEADDAPSIAEAPDDEPTATIDEYDSRVWHAQLTTNIDGSGRDWVGERFSAAKQSGSISVGLPTTAGKPVMLRGRIATKLSVAGSYQIDLDGQTIRTGSIAKTSGETSTETAMDMSNSIEATSSVVNTVNMRYGISAASDAVWLTYISLTGKAPLAMNGEPQLLFRNYDAYSDKATVTYSVAGASSVTQVWDVTDPTRPLKVDAQMQGSKLTFTAKEDILHEYVAFATDGTFGTPTDEGDVGNQDLHSHTSVNYLVLTTEKFRPWAERLAALHSALQGLSTRVVCVDDIYNEFSGGRREAPGIRNYIKMLYDRGQGTADELSLVLLFGSGSYDNYDRSSEANVVPTYQSANSYGLVTSYSTDDFYGWMDDGEGASDTRSTIDIGLGRLPVMTETEAEIITSKIEKYMTSPPQGVWRRKALFLACAGDENEHSTYADRQATHFEEENPDMEVMRIFTEAYPSTTTSTGTGFPQAVSEATTQYNGGTLIVHYTGHGGPTGFGDNLMTKQLAQELSNGDMQMFFVGATCTFVPFDQEHGNSSSLLLFNSHGGIVGTFASTREVYGNSNYSITRPLMKHVLSLDGKGATLTLGEAMKLAKQEGPKSINSVKYHLIGDPGMVLAVPQDRYVSFDKVNGIDIAEQTEALHALSKGSLEGTVRLLDGTVDEDFEGTVIVKLYDKRSTKQTSGVMSGSAYQFSEWSSLLYSGTVSVSKGRFDVNFYLTKEINFEQGYGRASAYATSEAGDEAMGATDAILIGGVTNGIEQDTIGPEMNIWLDYPEFDDGDGSGSTPVLYVRLSDAQGINVSGQGIGHDISLVIDGDRVNAVSLNNYFSYDNGSFTDGLVAYQLDGLTDGMHTLTVRAWDNMNNSTSQSITTQSSTTQKISFGSTKIYTSGGKTRLLFSHNSGRTTLKVDIRVYTLGGRLIGSGTTETAVSDNLSGEIVLDDYLRGDTGCGNEMRIVRCEVEADGRHGSFTKKFIKKGQ